MVFELFGVKSVIADSASDAVWLSYFNEYAEPLDWAKVVGGDAPVVLIGETHNVPEFKSEIVNHMAEIKSTGISHLALEALPSNLNSTLKQFNRDGSQRDKILNQIQNGWGFAVTSFMGLIDSANRNGLTVLATDTSAEPLNAIYKNVYKLKTYPEQAEASKKHCRLKDSTCFSRDCNMTDEIIKAIKNGPGSRVLMYVGARHASVNVQPKHLSLLHGIKSKSIVMVDGLKGHYRIAYEKSKWAGQPVFLPLKRREIDKVENSTSKELSPYNSDYDGAILLPRVTEVFF